MQEKITNIVTFFSQSEIQRNIKFNACNNKVDKAIKQHLKDLVSSLEAEHIQQNLKETFHIETDIKKGFNAGLGILKEIIFDEPVRSFKMQDEISTLASCTLQAIFIVQSADKVKEKIFEFCRWALLGSQTARRLVIFLTESLLNVIPLYTGLARPYLLLLYSELQELVTVKQQLHFVSTLYKLATYLKLDAAGNAIVPDFHGLLEAMSVLVSKFAYSKSNVEDLIGFEKIISSGVLDISELLNSIKVEDERTKAKEYLISLCGKVCELVEELEKYNAIQSDIQQDWNALRRDENISTNQFYAEKILKRLIVIIALRDGHDKLAILFVRNYFMRLDGLLLSNATNTEKAKAKFYAENIRWLTNIAEKSQPAALFLCKYHLAKRRPFIIKPTDTTFYAPYYFATDIFWAVSRLQEIIESQEIPCSKKAFVLLANNYCYKYFNNDRMSPRDSDESLIRDIGEYCQKTGEEQGYYEHLLIVVEVHFDRLQIDAIDMAGFADLRVNFLTAYERASPAEKPQVAERIASLYLKLNLDKFEGLLLEYIVRDMLFWAIISIMQECTSLSNVKAITMALARYPEWLDASLETKKIFNCWDVLQKQGDAEVQAATFDKDENPYLEVDKELLEITITVMELCLKKTELKVLEGLRVKQVEHSDSKTLRMSFK